MFFKTSVNVCGPEFAIETHWQSISLSIRLAQVSELLFSM